MKTTHSRKFGKWQVEVTERGGIHITGDWYSNYGVYYPHNFDRYQRGQLDMFGKERQVIGMDSMRGLTKQVDAWLHNLVKNNKLEHLKG